jgi:thiamine kinase-like enzyme
VSAADDDTAALLAGLPGFAHARCTPLPAGSNNAGYLLEQGGVRAVLKVAATARQFPLLTRADEAAVQARAHRAGVAPEVLYVDERRLLEAYIPGTVLSDAALARPANLAALALVLRRLHALPPTGRRFPLRESARLYRDTLRTDVDTEQADCRLAAVEAVVAIEPGNPLRCCHNDLVAGNIVAAPSFCLLDWEYAGDNDPLFDLATIVAHHAVPPAGAGILLEAYFGAGGAHHAAALERMCHAYAALAWLWAASRPPAGTAPG